MSVQGFNVVKDITIEKAPSPLDYRRKTDDCQPDAGVPAAGEGREVPKDPGIPGVCLAGGLVNAVTHRDYSISGEYIRVTMYDDRIEFLSPGRLPSIVTVENIQNTRFSRNPLIARVLTDFGWVRELNEGVKRIYTDMRSYFLEPPIFSEPNKKTVLLVLKKQYCISFTAEDGGG